MNLTKDTYEYLLNFAEDRDIINMLSVNKKFQNEEFFERLMKRKYPDLIRYREKNESWKHLFVRMVYYIARLEEKFKIPYFNGLNILELFSKQGHVNPIFSIVRDAAKIGNLEIIKLFTFEGKSLLFYEALETAIENHRINIIEELLNQRPKAAHEAAASAIENGYLDILKFIIQKKNIKNLNALLDVAAENNRKEIANYLISQGANDFESASYYARVGGHEEMMDYLQTFI